MRPSAISATRGSRTWKSAVGVAAAALLCAACDSDGPTSPTTPLTPTPLPGISLGRAEGSVVIRLVSVSPAPGSTISGCGVMSTGCAGRVRMTFALTSPTDGIVHSIHGSLHSSTTKVACLTGTVPGARVPAGESEIEILFDGGQDCPTPVTLSDVALTVSGNTNQSGRQEWGINYTLRQ